VHRPRKRFGQHFLAPAWARKVVDAIAPAAGDVFVEIGPGSGALTIPLAASGVPVVAVEVDRDLAAALADRAPRHVTIVTGDFLVTDVTPLLTGLEPQRTPDQAAAARPPRRYRVAGNLPYNLSTPLLFRLLELHRHTGLFHDATLMLQREVADRLLARPGTKAYGALTVFSRLYTETSRLLELPPGAFTPPPKVRSTLIRLRFVPPSVKVPDEVVFTQLVRALFSQRRKRLSNAMKRFDPAVGSAVLAVSGLDPGRRPETLDLQEIARLAELTAEVRRPAVL
jgi:16S rRNA (adenine1518-N6/adenine1519-N6)-dimethyltransferase